ncbi:zinc-binding dehydrogenase [Streptomyces shenzhenensis]|uniref:Uncharacterized protein n=1 Tax=Streptomyces shenzhenensis TaxID=943815 RepID=A0A3M0I3S7_9ACTN|nr:zinc-binding dehydrogenase [Streptomyces shenzhenensis]RMB83867.1 hypothetical protein CTZ28_22505 [Streptomyces shenzhenensis]
MRAIRLTGPYQVEIVDLPDAPLGERDVRLRSIVSAISHGTELNTYRGTAPLDKKRFDPELRTFVPDPEATGYPATLGYEIVSEVVETGAAVTEVAVGDLVHTGTPHQDMTVTSPDDYLGFYPMVKLPDHPTHEPGLFASLAAVALQGVHDAAIKVGDVVTVHGAGAIGLMTIQLAVTSGATVIAVEPSAERRAEAEKAGARLVLDPAENDGLVGYGIAKALKGRSPDVAIETSGSYHGLQGAISAAGMAGQVVALGFYQGGGTPLRLGEEWHHNRITMRSSMGVWDCPHRSYPAWDRPRMMRTVVDLLYSGRLRTDFMPVQHHPFDHAAQVYADLAASPVDHLKTAFDYRHGSGADGS